MLIDSDAVVYAIAGQPLRVSNNSIEERIRTSFALQRVNGTVMRTWGFSLDGHDFYVVNLVSAETIVFDLTTQQWSEWKSDNLASLNFHTGMNWLGAKSGTYTRSGNNIIAGSSLAGDLTLGDPRLGYDENVNSGVVVPYVCEVTGGLPMRNRESLSCNAVYLTLAQGNPIAGAGLTLETSDDYGKTFVNHGTITVIPGDFTQEFAWRSLGQIVAPGRIFKITDAGATHRIDSLDMK
jgi:hypothetical protein